VLSLTKSATTVPLFPTVCTFCCMCQWQILFNARVSLATHIRYMFIIVFNCNLLSYPESKLKILAPLLGPKGIILESIREEMMDKRTKCQAIAPACWKVIYLNVLQQTQNNKQHVIIYYLITLSNYFQRVKYSDYCANQLQ